MLSCLLTDTVSLDIDRAIHYALLWGFDGVELRSVGSAESRVPNVNLPKLLRRLEESELQVAAVAPGLFEDGADRKVSWLNDLELLKETVPFCERLGCTRIVVSAFSAAEVSAGAAGLRDAAAGVLAAAADITSRSGVTVVVLNEVGTLCETADELAGLVAAAGHDHCRAGWSPAESVRAGEDPAAACAGIAPFLELMRFRDGRSDGYGWEESVPGSGDVPWIDLMAQIARAGFEGPVSLEVRREPKAREGFQASNFLHDLLRAARRTD